MAFIAYYLHWPPSELLEMPHWERREWCRQISRTNEALNEGADRRRG